MTMAAPYNPATLALMRSKAHLGAGGLSALLGWTENSVIEKARRHQIDLGVAPPYVASPDISPPAPDRDRIRSKSEDKRKRTATVAGGIELTPRQAQIFVILSRRNGLVAGRHIAEQLGIDPTSVSCNVADLRSRLYGKGFAIKAIKGPSGGYRLVRTDGSSPTLAASHDGVSASPLQADSSARNPRSPRYPQARN